MWNITKLGTKSSEFTTSMKVSIHYELSQFLWKWHFFGDLNLSSKILCQSSHYLLIFLILYVFCCIFLNCWDLNQGFYKKKKNQKRILTDQKIVETQFHYFDTEWLFIHWIRLTEEKELNSYHSRVNWTLKYTWGQTQLRLTLVISGCVILSELCSFLSHSLLLCRKGEYHTCLVVLLWGLQITS